MLIIEIIIGAVLAALMLFAFGNARNEERLKKFFAGSLVIAALVYVGFASIGVAYETASYNWLWVEFLGILIYTFFAYSGVRISAWFLAFGWTAHVLWDVILHSGEAVAFVPGFYPGVCIGFDIVFGVYIVYRFYIRD